MSVQQQCTYNARVEEAQGQHPVPTQEEGPPQHQVGHRQHEENDTSQHIQRNERADQARATLKVLKEWLKAKILHVIL